MCFTYRHHFPRELNKHEDDLPCTFIYFSLIFPLRFNTYVK
jgi:hypothetical protein